MDPKPSNPGMLFAPSHRGSSGALRLPAREPPPARELPPVDERLVRPETREQLVRGRSVLAMPANPPHGDRHFKLDYVLGAHVKEGYVGSTNLLTRSAPRSDFATDTCVRRDGIDPVTKTRYLEELAFEVVNEQSLRDITEKAEDLSARGVRRVVAIFVKTGEVREWLATRQAWSPLDPQGVFHDPTLARPLRVQALLDAAEADNEVARALLAKNNPVLAALRTEGREGGLAEGRKDGLAEGRKDGLAEGVEVACALLGIELTAPRRAHLSALDAAGLQALLAGLRAERRWP